MVGLDRMVIKHQSDYSRSGFNMESDGFQFDMEFEEQSTSSVYSLLLDTVMTKTFQSYSVWQTSGSDYIKPCLFSTQGLPSVQKMPAMLSGDWNGCGWQQPYMINEFQDIREEA
jgi:type VI secretion system protein ImpM